ncbi:hypothetical protein [Flavisolibacter ginsengisoli]|jgi:hypothetical protein|uniref:Uncharacterized protein n=1 Tax=Flavisolibacter ginsengisoli DSM 18119 TaxID=1121884 RepID=A0A1M5BIZ8_9BACT|nr:hypothetical protein [Flavisolibacter ginsengisoli]SHF42408.1 hypothetical protein SAMN02745131_02604 [Flavisolibacter ginsengisoli DSM 18119]
METLIFQPLIDYLARVPAILSPIGTGIGDDGLWWVKFQIDIVNPLSWHVVQEFGCVINYLSLNERLPTLFYPVSPAPYLNGGPGEYLSWVIESKDKEFTPAILRQWLEGRLPNPVDQLSEWNLG